MSVARLVTEVLRDHVVLEVEAIDRKYFNVYVPHLQSVRAVVDYLLFRRGQRFASTTAVTQMTRAFVRNIDQIADRFGYLLAERSQSGTAHGQSTRAAETAVNKYYQHEKLAA